MSLEKPYLIFTTKRGPLGNSCMWYRPNAMGYTEYLEDAGFYTEEEAKSRCKGMDYLHMIHEDEVYPKTKSVVPFEGPDTFKK